jgi:probable HAF family extracellular repeat protein
MRRRIAAVAVLLSLTGSSAWGDVQYTVTDLGTLGGTHSEAWGINNSGQIVGRAWTSGNSACHAFLYSGGSMQDLGTFGGSDSLAAAVNDSGQVVGRANTSGGIYHAFFHSGSGPLNPTTDDLGTFGGTYSEAWGINNNGQVVGEADFSDGVYHAFVHNGSGLLNPATDDNLGTLGGNYSIANGINDRGQIVGRAWTSGNAAYHACLWSGGTITDLGTFGGWMSAAFAINNNGQIVGLANTAPRNSTTHTTPSSTTVAGPSIPPLTTSARSAEWKVWPMASTRAGRPSALLSPPATVPPARSCIAVAGLSRT